MPCRHLSAVFVADDSLRLVGVEHILNVAHLLGSLPLLAGVRIEISHVMARLVAVGILSDKTRNVAGSIFTHVALCNEERVETGDKGCVAAKYLYQPFRMLGNKEGVLPTCALSKVAHSIYRAEGVVGSASAAVVHKGTNKTDVAVVILGIIPAALDVVLVVFLLAHLLCHKSRAPVVHGIFHGDGGSLVHLVARDIAFLHHVRDAVLLHIRCRYLHGLESAFGIKAAETLQIGIGNDGHGAVARHTVGLATH